MYYDSYTNQWVSTPSTVYPQMQPVQRQQFTPQKTAASPTPMPAFSYVLGEEEAKAMQVAPGTTAYMFNTQEPVAYIKEVDYAGKPIRFETYDLVLRVEKSKEEVKPIDASIFVTNDQLASTIAEVKEELRDSLSKEIADAFSGLSFTAKTAKSSKNKGE